jgi:hypothetical protein
LQISTYLKPRTKAIKKANHQPNQKWVRPSTDKKDKEYLKSPSEHRSKMTSWENYLRQQNPLETVHDGEMTETRTDLAKQGSVATESLPA